MTIMNVVGEVNKSHLRMKKIVPICSIFLDVGVLIIIRTDNRIVFTLNLLSIKFELVFLSGIALLIRLCRLYLNYYPQNVCIQFLVIQFATTQCTIWIWYLLLVVFLIHSCVFFFVNNPLVRKPLKMPSPFARRNMENSTAVS